MKARIAAGIALVALLGSGGANASSGADLLDQCQSAIKQPATMNAVDLYKSGFCQGTITSVIALSGIVNEGLPADARVCVNQYDARNLDIVNAVVNSLRANPADQSQDASLATLLALQQSYPCR